MTSAPIYSVDDFLSAFQKLMPRGAAWRTDTDSIQAKTERGLVTTWNRINIADYNLLVDAFPASAVGLLPEWEATLGLPDPCAGEASTISERQKQVVAKLTNSGGQSAQYFIDLAAELGYSITVTEFAPFRAGQSHAGDPLGGPWSFYTFQINAPLQSINYFRAGASFAGEPLQTWGNDVLECVIDALAPAHVDVIFSYGGDIPEGFGVDFSTGKFYSRPVGGAPVTYANFTDMFTFTRASAGTYRDAAGVVQTVANNVPRIECGPTGALQGLLVEDSRQNICLYSEALENAAWNNNNASSVAANVTLAPDGTNNADQIVEDNTNADHLRGQVVNFTAGSVYTFSAFLKPAGRGWAALFLGGAAFGSSTTAFFNLATGAVGTLFNSPAVSVTPYPNGWFRVSITKTATITAGAAIRIFCSPSDNGSPYLGDGASGIYVWGAQVEIGPAPSSYIATAAAAVTRAADVCTRNIGGEFNALAGTAVTEGTSSPAQNPTLSQAYWNFDDGSTANRIGLVRVQATDLLGLRVFDAGVFQSTADVVTGNLVPFKSAAAWQLNDFAQSLNGAAPITDNLGTIPHVSIFSLGLFLPASGLQGNCRIKKFTYYPTRKANAELQALSA